MKIRIVPVAAGLAAAAGIALTGASLASADTNPASASTAARGGRFGSTVGVVASGTMALSADMPREPG